MCDRESGETLRCAGVLLLFVAGRCQCRVEPEARVTAEEINQIEPRASVHERRVTRTGIIEHGA